ncbi:DUF5677 domain-containing protein [Heyndrickxia ginsengihumi]|uniref:DUF5677 domain-containing protein n=1 Tax=Heyndrickxia ginsengihumi TaxID=363870 RepID=UPI003D1A7555
MENLHKKIINVFDEMEKRFGESSGSNDSIRLLIYQLYNRAKRTYLASWAILKHSGISASYIEILPNLRVLLENLFHIKFIINSKDKNKVTEEYDLARRNFEYQLYKNYKEYKTRFDNGDEKNSLHEDELKFLSDNDRLEKPERKVIFTDIKSFSQLPEVNEFGYYVRIYKILNSTIHFDPSTVEMYGSMVDGKFIFNVFDDENTKESEKVILRYLSGLTLNTTSYISDYFKYTDVDEIIKNALSEWVKTFN